MSSRIIFIDSEGDPVQELAALYVVDNEVVDTYLKYAKCPHNVDWWGRKHVHGLWLSYLAAFGFSCEEELINDFKQWISLHPCDIVLANNPCKEQSYLMNVSIFDIGLPQWMSRYNLMSHQLAIAARDN